MLMDINEALNRIIFKYELDRYYPHYKNMCKAEKILQNIVKHIMQYRKKAVFVGDDRTGIEFIRNISRGQGEIGFLLYERNQEVPGEIEAADWKQYDEIYVISFRGAEYIERWFRLQGIQYEWIYDIFEQEGIFLQRDFYAFGKEDLYFLNDKKGAMHNRDGWTESLQCELYNQQSKYNTAGSEQTRRISLEKCLFLSLYIKNFKMVFRYSSVLAETDGKYKNFEEDIQDLLRTVKKAAVHRKQEDIILYWLDSIPFCDVGSMSHLQTIMNDSVVFENAFTYIPYTHPALRSMFLGKKDIDDQAYSISNLTSENSPVIRLLEEQGYDIKVFSGYFSDYFPSAYRSRHFYTDVCAPISMKLWDMFSEMLLTERKTLWLVHALESHAPYMSAEINDNNYREPGELRRLARMEIDDQLAFYDSFVNRDTFRIYMSDHGDGTMLQRRIQIFFGIYHRRLKAKRIEGLFSLLDFGTVLKNIIEEGEIREENFSREYVEIGNLDLYNPKTIKNLFKNKEEINEIYFGYKGVIDREHIYIHYTMGKEWLSCRKDMRNPILFYECAQDICKPELLPVYRERTGDYPEEMLRNSKFRYSQYLHALYYRVLKHNDIANRVSKIEQLLEKFPDHSVGIRMGGYHSLVLYYVLSERYRNKIWGFIDNNADCMCSTLRLPVVRPDALNRLAEGGVKAILLSSFFHIQALRKESRCWSSEIEILDIYMHFVENGMPCDTDFWITRGREEDYDMELPG